MIINGVFIILLISSLFTQVIQDRQSTTSLDSSVESSISESNPPQASAGTSLQSISVEQTPLPQQNQEAVTATAGATAAVATPTPATPTTAPQHSTALQRAVSLFVMD